MGRIRFGELCQSVLYPLLKNLICSLVHVHPCIFVLDYYSCLDINDDFFLPEAHNWSM